MSIELTSPSAKIKPQDEYYETTFGLFLKREETKTWRGVVVDNHKIDGVRNGDEVIYIKNKAEVILVNEEEYHIVPDEQILAVIKK